MIVGIPKEIKNNENRVGMTPAGVNELVKHGHTVYVQKGAGENSGFPDSSYERVGAKILATIEDVYAISEMIVKVKEPIAPEYPLIRKGQLLFTYFHFASDRRLTEAMMSSGATCLAYETVELKDHSLPLLIPMSEVAGRMATQEGARFLERPQGGKGKLMGGVPGVKPAKVLVIGAGVVGYSSARIAAGMGADVTITDLSLSRLRHIDEIKPANIKTLYSSEFNIRAELPTTDLVVGAVLIPGAKAPHLITRDMLSTMEKGSVLVDGIIHYCVANIPGAVSATSTLALTNATLPYVVQLADKGWQKACSEDEALYKGLNIVDGKIVYPAVAEAFGLPCETI